MRRIEWAVGAVVACLTGGWLLAETIVIEDPGLEAAVRESLEKPQGPLTTADLATLTWLDASRREITSLDGFRGAIHLEEFDLGFNQIEELRLPPDLTALWWLRARGNPLRRIEFSGPLPALRELDLNECLLTAPPDLAAVPALERLALQANALDAFAVPAIHDRLRHLDLSFNRVRNLGFLARLPAVAELILDDNGLAGVELPGPLPQLRLLSLGINRLKDLQFLTQTTGLETLDLTSNVATNFVFPAGLTNLQWLNLGENRLVEIALPADATNLMYLYADDNRLTAVPELRFQPRLALLDAGINRIAEAVIPHALTNLTTLQLRFNPLATLVLPDVLATNSLAEVVKDAIRTGVVVHVYPITPRLALTASPDEATLSLELAGPPGIHEVLAAGELAAWRPVAHLTNRWGTARWTTDARERRRFFQTRLP